MAGEDYTTELGWIEYCVFAVTIGVVVLIGMYFWLVNRRASTTIADYLLAGKTMTVLPVSVSLVCSNISGVTVLGIPTEVYTFGTQYLISLFSYIIVGFIIAYLFLPVFYKLQTISLYEYLEMRFDLTVRRVVSVFFNLLIYAVGVNVLLTSFVLTAICVFYTTIGGLKAVIWTDTFQGVVMLAALVVVSVVGLIKVGGLTKVIDSLIEGDRLEFFVLDPDPRRRITFWTSMFGVTAVFTYLSGIQPAFIQRYICLPTIEQAKRAVLLFVIGSMLFFCLSGFIGMLIYAQYKGCDPKSAGLIKRVDQIVPLFVLNTASDMPGTTGLFLSGIVAAALSTMSTCFNTMSCTVFLDLIQPLSGNISDARSSMTMKAIVVVSGVLCLCVLLIIDKVAGILELAYISVGLSAGSILGIFLLGLLFPRANSLGASIGGLISLGVMIWIMVKARLATESGDIIIIPKPVSTDSCGFNVTTVVRSIPEVREGNVFPLYEISVFYYCLLGCLICLVVGLLISYLRPSKKTVNRDLLSPLIHRFVKDYKIVPDAERLHEKHKLNRL